MIDEFFDFFNLCDNDDNWLDIDMNLDVECKQCKRKVKIIDKECWWCCTKEPGIVK
jgi:hypothetical protein